MLGHLAGLYPTSATYAGAIPIGALAGGVLGELIGLRETLAVAAIGLLFAPLWVIRSPIPDMHRLPDRPDDALAVTLT